MLAYAMAGTESLPRYGPDIRYTKQCKAVDVKLSVTIAYYHRCQDRTYNVADAHNYGYAATWLQNVDVAERESSGLI